MEFTDKISRGLKAAFKNPWRGSATLIISGLFFILLALSKSINYSIQMFSAAIEHWLTAILFTIRRFYLNGGWTEVTLNVIYSLLVGITITNTYAQYRSTGLKIGNLSGIAPGMLVTGCAGCGVGLLSFIGMAGIMTSLPFQGTGLKRRGNVALNFLHRKNSS